MKYLIHYFSLHFIECNPDNNVLSLVVSLLSYRANSVVRVQSFSFFKTWVSSLKSLHTYSLIYQVSNSTGYLLTIFELNSLYIFSISSLPCCKCIITFNAISKYLPVCLTTLKFNAFSLEVPYSPKCILTHSLD